MTKLCISKNRSLFLQKYVIKGNAETLAYDFIICPLRDLSLNCQFNAAFVHKRGVRYTIEFTEIGWTYLVNLPTCKSRAAELTSHTLFKEGDVMNILEEFWYGNIEPAEYDTSSGKEYKELLQLISRNEDKLLATMTDDQKELFTKYADCVREYQVTAEYLLFQNSFRLGGRMMLEVMRGDVGNG